MARNRLLWKRVNTVLLVALLATVLGVLFFPVDVIYDDTWEVKVNGGNTHKVGESIQVDSIYQKLRKAEGQANRYLDCKTERGTYLRYELNKADANRRPSLTRQGTAFTFGIPNAVKPLPTECRVAIDIRYNVFKVGGWSIRTVSEYQESKPFNLVKE